MITLVMAMLASAICSADDRQGILNGPIDSIWDLQETAKMAFKLTDTNNDGQISQKEATDVGNLLVGGFFFRADTNGDGVLTPQEAEQARAALYVQQPLLRFVLERARPTNLPHGNKAESLQPIGSGASNDPTHVAQSLATDPMRTIGNLLDTNNDQKIDATELRQAVQTGVSTLFMVADTNQDGQLVPYELNAAIGEIANSAVQSVFQAADLDRNNMLSMQEYDKFLAEPAHAVFRVLDANGDGHLTLEELRRAKDVIADELARLRVPEPSNSMANQGRKGGTGYGTTRPVTQPATSAPTVAPTPGPATTPR